MGAPNSNLDSELIIKKFGGATLASPDHIRRVAHLIKDDWSQGNRLVIVVSAMGKTTNSLIELAHQVASHPNQREMDMLLSVGERISMSLLSMALQDLGVPAISLTGSQAGIWTSPSHENAQIIDVKPLRVREELEKNKVIILAGFQGVDPIRKEITTLGRGGTDTTAVAMSAALGADECQILKDVAGVFTADPNRVPEARRIPRLNYSQLMEMTYWGAKVLHYRSVELAASKNVKLFISKVDSANDKLSGTQVGSEEMMESSQLLAINSHADVLSIHVTAGSVSESLDKLNSEFSQYEIIFPQILHITSSPNLSSFQIFLTGPTETLQQIRKSKFEHVVVDSRGMTTVALTCSGLPLLEGQKSIFQKLNEIKVVPLEVWYSALSVILLLEQKYLDQSLVKLHELIISGEKS